MREQVISMLMNVFECEADELDDDKRLDDDLNISSMQTFLIAAELSELTEKTVSFKRVKQFITVGGLLEFVENSNK